MWQNRNVLRSTPVAPAPESDPAEDEHFERGGYIRRNFHHSARWQESYERVAEVSRKFVSLACQGGREGYEWPLDPLHTWSRVWEYPFVAEQLRRFECEGRGLRLLDIGAAVTFFSFYLQRQGFQLTNLDFDLQMPVHFERIFRRTSKQLGVDARPTYLAADARDTKLPDGSFDVVTCISVLEHIPGWERAVGEINRLLKPGGLFILTFDVQHSGPADALSAADCQRLLRLLSETMDAMTAVEDAIPADALTPHNGGWQPRVRRLRSYFGRIWPLTSLPGKILRRVRGRRVLQEICVFGGVWRKR